MPGQRDAAWLEVCVARPMARSDARQGFRYRLSRARAGHATTEARSTVTNRRRLSTADLRQDACTRWQAPCLSHLGGPEGLVGHERKGARELDRCLPVDVAEGNGRRILPHEVAAGGEMKGGIAEDKVNRCRPSGCHCGQPGL